MARNQYGQNRDRNNNRGAHKKCALTGADTKKDEKKAEEKPRGPKPDYRPAHLRLVKEVEKTFSPLSELNNFPVWKSFNVGAGTDDDTVIQVIKKKIAPSVEIEVIAVTRSKNPVLAEMAKKEIFLSVGAFRATDEKWVKKDNVPQHVFDYQTELRRVLKAAITWAETNKDSKKVEGKVAEEVRSVKEKKKLPKEVVDAQQNALRGEMAANAIRNWVVGSYCNLGAFGTIVRITTEKMFLIFSQHENMQGMKPYLFFMKKSFVLNSVFAKNEKLNERLNKKLEMLHSFVRNLLSENPARMMPAQVPSVVPSVAEKPAITPAKAEVKVEGKAIGLGSVKIETSTVGRFYIRVSNGRVIVVAKEGKIHFESMTKAIPGNSLIRDAVAFTKGKLSISLQALTQKPTEKVVREITDWKSAERELHRLAYDAYAPMRGARVLKTTQTPAHEPKARPHHVKSEPAMLTALRRAVERAEHA